MLGPLEKADSPYFHCSPLLTKPKDKDRRRVILNLSHPYGTSVNDHVSKNKFDGRCFTLKFPSIDDIVEAILAEDDPVLFKIDISTAFRNLRIDPVDSLKFGLKWDDAYYLDLSVVFGWTHGSAAFQTVSDAVTYVTQKMTQTRLLAYIDNYVGVASSVDAERQIHQFHALLTDLDLPMNKNKINPPCKVLMCLGIQIDIENATLSIEPAKLTSIHQECIHIASKKFISKKNFQSLLI